MHNLVIPSKLHQYAPREELATDLACDGGFVAEIGVAPADLGFNIGGVEI